jgi:hypothetical protein
MYLHLLMMIIFIIISGSTSRRQGQDSAGEVRKVPENGAGKIPETPKNGFWRNRLPAIQSGRMTGIRTPTTGPRVEATGSSPKRGGSSKNTKVIPIPSPPPQLVGRPPGLNSLSQNGSNFSGTADDESSDGSLNTPQSPDKSRTNSNDGDTCLIT